MYFCFPHQPVKKKVIQKIFIELLLTEEMRGNRLYLFFTLEK